MKVLSIIKTNGGGGPISSFFSSINMYLSEKILYIQKYPYASTPTTKSFVDLYVMYFSFCKLVSSACFSTRDCVTKFSTFLFPIVFEIWPVAIIYQYYTKLIWTRKFRDKVLLIKLTNTHVAWSLTSSINFVYFFV